jgi:hypothetical protein
MTIYKGPVEDDLTVEQGDDATCVTSVGGGLDIYAEGAQLPALTSVGSSLYINAEGAHLPALTSVGSSLYIDAEGAHLPALTSVGGGLEIRAGKHLHAPQLSKVAGYPIATPEAASALLLEVAKAALAAPYALTMSSWHCGTSHCIAGWAVHLAPGGYELEAEMKEALGSDKTLAAGNILLGVEASSLFFLDDEAARSALRRVLDGKPALEMGQ